MRRFGTADGTCIGVSEQRTLGIVREKCVQKVREPRQPMRKSSSIVPAIIYDSAEWLWRYYCSVFDLPAVCRFDAALGPRPDGAVSGCCPPSSTELELATGLAGMQARCEASPSSEVASYWRDVHVGTLDDLAVALPSQRRTPAAPKVFVDGCGLGWNFGSSTG